jgi:GNAT superfamily N-acetyltransferase
MIEVRPATSDEDLAHIAGIVCAVTPDNPTSVSEMRWQEEHYPGGRRFIAWLDGVAVAGGGVGRVYVYPPEFPGLWGNITVLPEHRRQGVGTAMYAAISDVAREQGKTMLVGRTTSDRPDAIAWMERRGFEEHERMKVVRLALVGRTLPDLEVPDGVEITSLEARPDLVGGVYAVAKEALPDIPGDGPVAPDTLEEFVMRDVHRAVVPHGGFAVALEKGTGRVVGYGNLLSPPGTSKIAWHGMTAVARDWRGRGLARALKVSTIHWAAANGLEGLDTANDIDNAPMRAVNRRLGYEPQPDEIYFRGPLAPLREGSRR